MMPSTTLRAATHLAGATVKVLAARTGAVEHFWRCDVVGSAAKIPRRIRVQISERRIPSTALMVGQRLVHDGVVRHLRQRDFLAHVLQVRAICRMIKNWRKFPKTAERTRDCLKRA